MARVIVAAVLLGPVGLSPPVWAEETAGVVELVQKSSELVFSTDDLIFNIGDFVLRIDTLAGQTDDLSGSILGLEIIETETETRIELPADILFDPDKAEIRPDAARALRQAAEILRGRAHGAVRIEGHTDATGTPSFNQTLSEQQAQSVLDWLVKNEQLGATNFIPKGLAATMPLAPNVKPDGSDDRRGRQKNRRIDIVIPKQ